MGNGRRGAPVLWSWGFPRVGLWLPIDEDEVSRLSRWAFEAAHDARHSPEVGSRFESLDSRGRLGTHLSLDDDVEETIVARDLEGVAVDVRDGSPVERLIEVLAPEHRLRKR